FGLVFGTAADADTDVGGHADEADLVGLPVRDAVGLDVVLGLLQHRLVDAVADRDIRADAVLNVLENLAGARASPEAHHGATYPVRVDPPRLDHPDLVAPVVVHQQGATLLNALVA